MASEKELGSEGDRLKVCTTYVHVKQTQVPADSKRTEKIHTTKEQQIRKPYQRRTSKNDKITCMLSLERCCLHYLNTELMYCRIIVNNIVSLTNITKGVATIIYSYRHSISPIHGQLIAT